MEADRFQHLKYTEPEFKTESLAVLGEYNKNSANPLQQAERSHCTTRPSTATLTNTPPWAS